MTTFRSNYLGLRQTQYYVTLHHFGCLSFTSVW